MKKTFTALALLCAMLLSGCGNILDISEVVTEDYIHQSAEDENPEESIFVECRADLIDVMTALTYSGTSATSLIFSSDYEGSVESDLKELIRDLRREDAYCAYALHDIEIELTRIVNHYQAELKLFYLEGAKPAGEIVQIPFPIELESYVLDTLEEDTDRLVVLIDASSYSSLDMRQLIEEVYRKHPVSCPSRPEPSVLIYSGSGKQRLYDITIEYEQDRNEQTKRRLLLKNLDIRQDIGTGERTDSEKLEALCSYFARNIRHCGGDAHNTAYDAFILHEADSEGISLAFVEAASRLGLDALAIFGRRDLSSYCWNMVRIDGSFYHVDITAQISGMECCLWTDEDMLGSDYRWDLDSYPACTHAFGQEHTEEN